MVSMFAIGVSMIAVAAFVGVVLTLITNSSKKHAPVAEAAEPLSWPWDLSE
jgi:hypothetical protein